MVTELDDAAFDREVLQADVPVVMDFWATWCPPCRVLDPIVEELAARYAGRVKFVKLNADDHQGTPERFGIRALPTLLFFKQGAVVKQIIGASGGMRDKLDAEIRQLL